MCSPCRLNAIHSHGETTCVFMMETVAPRASASFNTGCNNSETRKSNKFFNTVTHDVCMYVAMCSLFCVRMIRISRALSTRISWVLWRSTASRTGLWREQSITAFWKFSAKKSTVLRIFCKLTAAMYYDIVYVHVCTGHMIIAGAYPYRRDRQWQRRPQLWDRHCTWTHRRLSSDPPPFRYWSGSSCHHPCIYNTLSVQVRKGLAW